MRRATPTPDALAMDRAHEHVSGIRGIANFDARFEGIFRRIRLQIEAAESAEKVVTP